MAWTPEQQQIIDARGCSLVVSAAAGSGKTAVLVERICALLLEGADVERMLVATFTRAAASEMKARIVARLSEEIRRRGGGRGLSEQLLRVDHAPIGTLHGFCATVLRQYYYVVGLEPTFTAEDESVTAVLYHDVLQDVLDAGFERGDAGFLELAACWGGRDGGQLEQLVTKVYGAARNYPDSMRWLEEKVEWFAQARIEGSEFHGELRRMLLSDLERAESFLEAALRLSERPGGPQAYAGRIAGELQALRDAVALCGEGGLPRCAGLFGRLPSIRGEAKTPLAETVKALREKAKKCVESAGANPLLGDRAAEEEKMRALHPQLRALFELVREFDRAYAEEKRRANIVDFSDLEHLALAVLNDAAAREELHAAFDFVFVDEYQDISPIQDELLRRLSPEDGFFCVGDVKQSIYRFRSAEPQLFIRRLAAGAEGRGGRRIDLSKNFRSAGRVVDLVNYLFGELMSQRLGDVEYGAAERLVCGAAQPEGAPASGSELVLLDNGGAGEDELTRLEELIQVEREAAVAAQKVRELLGTPLWDGKRGTTRPIGYSDIVILLRRVSGVAADYAEVFRRAGVPVYAEAESGFVDELEIQLLINLLRLVDNSLRDYELLTSMYSVIGRFSLEDLLEIRGVYPDASFCRAAARYADELETELAGRVRAFLERLGRWRMFSRHADIEGLIYRICDDTGLLEYAGTLPDGEYRQANILHLARLARGYRGGLYDFLRNFERLDSGKLRPRRSGQPSGAVAIMSVHKSKGLEFPVVILANVGKQFNTIDSSEGMLLHGELGLGPRYLNARRRTRGNTVARLVLADRIRRDALSEEMRVLYVALTRARERLIVLGTAKDLAKSVEAWALPPTPAQLQTNARSWLDWFGPMALRCPSGGALRKLCGYEVPELGDAAVDWKISVISADQVKNPAAPATSRTERAEELLRRVAEAAVEEDVARDLSWRYPWGDVSALPSKVSATSLLDKRRNWRGPVPAPEIKRTPRFMETETKYTAAELGTFAHSALQLLPVKAVAADVPACLKGLVQRGLLPENIEGLIDVSWLERYLNSKLAARVRASGRVEREIPFNLSLPSREVFPGETSEEGILVQGIIDCCFLEDGQWVLLDYKTNRVDPAHTARQIADYYRPQLATYRRALERIDGRRVKQAYLYLLSVGLEVEVPLE